LDTKYEKSEEEHVVRQKGVATTEGGQKGKKKEKKKSSQNEKGEQGSRGVVPALSGWRQGVRVGGGVVCNAGR